MRAVLKLGLGGGQGNRERAHFNAVLGGKMTLGGTGFQGAENMTWRQRAFYTGSGS